MNKTVWKEREKIEKIVDFSEELIPQIRQIFINRGIDSQEKLEQSRSPKYEKLYDPFLMKDMDKAVTRICEALEKNQRILVYGDYDVDGTTSIALMYSFLRDRGLDEEHLQYYVPDRYTEGYGISEHGIQWSIEHKIDLLIALDCGIKANKTITLAQNNGIDVIVCDHHEQGEELPPAYAVLDPKRNDDTYPFNELSGCGVGYKLLQAVCTKLHLSLKNNLNKYLDYVAISTAADIVPMIDENHTLMYWGLQKIMAKPLPSVQKLLQVNGLQFPSREKKDDLNVSDIVFKIAPSINAAGRMASARTAVDLLTSYDEEKIDILVQTITAYNEERRRKEKDICDEALEMLERNKKEHFLNNALIFCHENRSTKRDKKEKISPLITRKNAFSHSQQKKQQTTNCTTVLYKDSWHKGVVGIAASKVLDIAYKPTIILCGEGDTITGSARSVSDFDLYSSLCECKEYLTAFGGHTHAAGLSLKKSDLEAFKNKFEKIVSTRILPEQKFPTTNIDGVISLQEFSEEFFWKVYKQKQMLAPFGPKNLDPVFAVYGITPTDARIVGRDRTHLSLRFSQYRLNAIGFGFAEFAEKIIKYGKNPQGFMTTTCKTIDICFTVGINNYNGVESIQLQLKDIRLSE